MIGRSAVRSGRTNQTNQRRAARRPSLATTGRRERSRRAIGNRLQAQEPRGKLPTPHAAARVTAIKSDPATADIVIIAVTGHATNYGLLQAKEAGAEAVLTKPCLPEDIIALIRLLAPSRA